MAANQYGMLPFNGKTDFDIWKQKIKCVLIQQKVFRAVTGIFLESEDKAKQIEMNETACSTIYLNLSDSVLRKVGILESAKELWEKLDSLYTDTSLPGKLFLLEKFFRFRLDLTKDIDENLDVFNKLIQNIKQAGDKHIDDYTPIVLLNAIPDSYNDVKSAIKYGRDEISLDIVVNGLRSKELDLKHARGSASQSRDSGEAMFVRGRSKGRSKNPKQNSQGKNASQPGRKRSKSRKRVCYNCGNTGHFIKDCPHPKKTEHASVAVDKCDLGDILMVCDHVNSVRNSLSEHEWLIDSGCTYHMSPFRDLFSTYELCDSGYVSLADNKRCNVLGVGDICLKFSCGSVFTIKNVRHVPDLCHNLLSVAALESSGLQGKWGNGCMKILKNSLVLFKAEKVNNLYVCHAKPFAESVNVVCSDKTSLWHNRLGHMSNKGLDVMRRAGYFGKDSVTSVPFCESCVLGKQHRVSFPPSSYPNLSKCSSVLEYVHADVWGPASVPTHGGRKYFLSIIDDFSRKVWVCLLEHKSDVFVRFREWKTLVENQTGRKVKTLRTDNGLEFCNKEMDKLCVDCGIKRHKTVPYTPQQNGIAERMNRSLLDKVRSMLATSGLSKKFWGEAVTTAAYLVNRSPSVPLGGKCPETVFTGKPLDLSNLRVFGCAAYAHQQGDKLDPRSKKCVFLGYPEGVKGYRLWDRNQVGFKVVLSRNVVFNETDFPCLTESASNPESRSDSTPSEVESVPVAASPLSVDPVISDDIVMHDYDSSEHDSPTTSSEVEHLHDTEHDLHDMGAESDFHDNNNLHELHVEPSSDNLHDYQLARDRSRRAIRRTADSMPDYAFIVHDTSMFAFSVFESLELNEPKTYREALGSKESQKWISAMKSEMDSLRVNQTWTLVPRPPNCSVVECKWLFKVKEEPSDVRFKARLVAKGFTQKEGVDYAEIFAPVVKFTTIRMMLALVAHHDWEMKQMDVTTAFLHGELDKTIYMTQPEGFVDPKRSEHVCLLRKALYGLKQSPRQWNIKFDKCMISLKFQKSVCDHCLYFKNTSSVPVFLLLYVDDMLIISPSLNAIKDVQKCLCANFAMKDLGDAKRILGINIVRDRSKRTLTLNQISYIEKVLSKFNMLSASPVNVPMASHFVLSKDQSPKTAPEIEKMKSVPYSSAIGSVMYLMVSTRPDIAYAVSCLSRYMSNPGLPHWNALKWLLRYLISTVKHGLIFSKCASGIELIGYVDSNYANDRDNRKSTTSYVFTLCGSCISWKSQLQPIVALSTTESEYVAATEAFKEAIWLKRLVSEIGFLKKGVTIFSDSQSAIQLCKNPVFHDRTKHIDVRFHFIRDIVDAGGVKLCKIPSEFNPADMGTKCLSAEKHLSCKRVLNFDCG
ncbi:unnamed protein product [Cuscuta epithymum]|uniref:Retrovirus-related Pol polyprotein from transposon TNT 1-94 n=3 Tax=Cuscuta epithymum TaxID=186058 RepID=A0AAV0C7Q2_9ASTE|nr:unnamed protein product [Cuscuta epithymum]